ncbi:MAG: hypothetical protein ACREEM_06020 [Blastocatellia bacterium]
MVTNRVGPPVRGADFFGREAFVKLASDKLKAGHVLLAAPRRFGKTSVMYRLMDDPQWDYRIVHADLEHLIDPASLIAELTEKLAKDGKLAKVLSGLSWLSQEAWSRFREMIYHQKVLGVDCKTYFDHYYSRFREYYQPHEEKAAKRILREMAVAGGMTRDACFQFYRSAIANADTEAFNLLMTDLESDFYVRFDVERRRYQFSCKLLRDWWLRHYGMEANS